MQKAKVLTAAFILRRSGMLYHDDFKRCAHYFGFACKYNSDKKSVSTWTRPLIVLNTDCVSFGLSSTEVVLTTVMLCISVQHVHSHLACVNVIRTPPYSLNAYLLAHTEAAIDPPQHVKIPCLHVLINHTQ